MEYKNQRYIYKGFIGLTIAEAIENYQSYAKRKAFEEAWRGAQRFYNVRGK